MSSNTHTHHRTPQNTTEHNRTHNEYGLYYRMHHTIIEQIRPPSPGMLWQVRLHNLQALRTHCTTQVYLPLHPALQLRSRTYQRLHRSRYKFLLRLNLCLCASLTSSESCENCR